MKKYFPVLFAFIINTSQATEEIKLLTSVKSYQTLINANLVKQQSDSSCGAASVATILKHLFNLELTEAELLEKIHKNFSGEDIIEIIPQHQKDIEFILQQMGKNSKDKLERNDFFKHLKNLNVDIQQVIKIAIAKKTDINLDDLETLIKDVITNAEFEKKCFSIQDNPHSRLFVIVPNAIVRIKTLDDIAHFTVVKGLCKDNSGEYIYLSDPSRGNIRLLFSEFLEIWVNKFSTTKQGCAGGAMGYLREGKNTLISKDKELDICPIR
jgi:predicted double-glycine peptidase